MSDTPPGADWRDVPWYRRTKEQRQARYIEAEGSRRAQLQATRAGRRDKTARSQEEARARTAKIKAAGAERHEEIRERHASRRAEIKDRRGARLREIRDERESRRAAVAQRPAAGTRPRRVMPRGTGFLIGYLYWTSILDMILVFLPLILGLLAFLGILVLVVYLVVT